MHAGWIYLYVTPIALIVVLVACWFIAGKQPLSSVQAAEPKSERDEEKPPRRRRTRR